MEVEVLLSVTPVTLTTGGVGSGTGSSSLLHDQKLVDNKTAATSKAACLIRFLLILHFRFKSLLLLFHLIGFEACLAESLSQPFQLQ